MIQTESPYYLPNPQAPASFTSAVGKFPDNPTFTDYNASNTHCRAAWGLRTISARNVHILGAGMYNWFQAYTQACVDTQDCQQRVVEFIDSPGMWLYNLITIGTVEMISSVQPPVIAKDNTNMNGHPFTSTVNAFMLDSYDSLIDDGYELPECTGDYSSVADVAAASANIDKFCINRYLVGAQAKMINGALEKYGRTLGDGYDAKFNIYARHIKSLVPAQILAYMSKAQDSGFWTCAKEVWVTCCSDCHSSFGVCSGCSNKGGCVSGVSLEPASCPSYIPSGVNMYDANVEKLHYTLTNEDGFYGDLMVKYGIDRKWVKIDRQAVYRPTNGCQYGWTHVPTQAEIQQCIDDKSKFWTGFPVPGDIVVSNPRALVAENADKTRELAEVMEDNAFWAEIGGTSVTYADMVDSTSLPAFMLIASVDSMDKVIEVANEVSEQERKAGILNFVMSILLLIPGAGVALDAAGMAILRSAILLIGDIGDVAIEIYSIVDNHDKSAIVDVFGFLFGRLGGLKGKVGTDEGFTSAAIIHRGISNEDLRKLAPVKDNMNNVKKARGSVCTL